jgi:Ca-activated chloride channel family protein
MSFLNIELLWLLLILPLLAAGYVLLQRRRHKYTLKFSSLSLVKEAMGNKSSIRRYIPPILLLVCMIASIFALARPAATIILPSQKSTVILAIDVSLSMLADDIKPTRLQAAEAAAQTFVKKEAKDVRIGVVAFSGTTAVVQAPTTNHELVLAAITRLFPQASTAIGSGILTSLDAIFEEPEGKAAPVSGETLFSFKAPPTLAPTIPKASAPAVIILLTDGQSNMGPKPLEILDQAISRGVRIYTVGVGSVEGTTLVLDRRYSVRVSLDEPTLEQIAERTGGKYFNAENETSLFNIYENLPKQLVFERQQTELTAAFTGLAIALALVAGILSLLWFNRF